MIMPHLLTLVCFFHDIHRFHCMIYVYAMSPITKSNLVDYVVCLFWVHFTFYIVLYQRGAYVLYLENT